MNDSEKEQKIHFEYRKALQLLYAFESTQPSKKFDEQRLAFKILEELLKEQVPHQNTRHSNS